MGLMVHPTTEQFIAERKICPRIDDFIRLLLVMRN